MPRTRDEFRRSKTLRFRLRSRADASSRGPAEDAARASVSARARAPAPKQDVADPARQCAYAAAEDRVGKQFALDRFVTTQYFALDRTEQGTWTIFRTPEAARHDSVRLCVRRSHLLATLDDVQVPPHRWLVASRHAWYRTCSATSPIGLRWRPPPTTWEPSATVVDLNRFKLYDQPARQRLPGSNTTGRTQEQREADEPARPGQHDAASATITLPPVPHHRRRAPYSPRKSLIDNLNDPRPAHAPGRGPRSPRRSEPPRPAEPPKTATGAARPRSASGHQRADVPARYGSTSTTSAVPAPNAPPAAGRGVEGPDVVAYRTVTSRPSPPAGRGPASGPRPPPPQPTRTAPEEAHAKMRRALDWATAARTPGRPRPRPPAAAAEPRRDGPARGRSTRQRVEQRDVARRHVREPPRRQSYDAAGARPGPRRPPGARSPSLICSNARSIRNAGEGVHDRAQPGQRQPAARPPPGAARGCRR